MEEKYFDKLMKLSLKAAKKNEVPVSALIVKNNKIIATAYNTRHKKNLILNHAEVIAIKKASHKLKTWHLNDCDLYVTLKPCTMCESIIKQSRLNKVYYILDKNENKKEFYKTKFIETNVCTQKELYHSQLKDFFQKHREIRDKRKHI